MNLAEFKELLEQQEEPPAGTTDPLRALWYDRKDDWEHAHRIVQEISGVEAAWVHAYLHRKEGDLGNAGYWYRRANRPASSQPLEAEWEEIAAALL